MMKIFPFLLLSFATIHSVKSLCDKAPVEYQKTIWKGSPPEDLKSWVGRSTYVWSTPVFLKQLTGWWGQDFKDELACLQTVVEEDQTTAVNHITIKDKTKYEDPFDMILEWPGKVSVLKEGQFDEYLYLLFSRGGVDGFYRCYSDPKAETSGKPLVAILVLNYDSNNEKQKTNIAAAKTVLAKVQSEEGVDLPTNC